VREELPVAVGSVNKWNDGACKLLLKSSSDNRFCVIEWNGFHGTRYRCFQMSSYLRFF
jgi:hypothetical protein